MPKYVWKDGGFRDPATGEAMSLPYEGQICLPQYTPDIPEYRSPIDGRLITTRHERREDLKKSGCIEAGDMPLKNGGKVRSETFARKHGLRWQGD